MTVLEILRCPGCSTRFAITQARVRPGLRRARCFYCDATFGIEAEVARLLDAPGPATPAEPPALAAPVETPTLAEPAATPPLAAPAEIPALAAPAEIPTLAAPAEPPALPEPEQAHALAAPGTVEAPEPPSFAPEDLRGGPDDFLDLGPESFEPAAAPEAQSGHFASARDAIEKLMGATPAPVLPARMTGRSTMDVEATLDALETTLGGSPAKEPAAAPRNSDLASTVKLTSEEIQVAIAGMGDSARTAAAPGPQRPEPSPHDATPSVLPDDQAPGPERLKIQLEQETCSNVSLEQMTAWVEQGRVQEYHLVARQFSEHWIEAGKVPALQPVFERMRKARGPKADEPAPPAPEPPPVKRGLFAGLFGRG